MINTKKQFIGILILVIAGFGIGIYLQDLKHRESTEAAWEANRRNLERFERIRAHNADMDQMNWQEKRDSIQKNLDRFIILRFRREMDSINRLDQQD